MSGKSKVRLGALFVTCLIAAPVATQAQASTITSAKVPANLRASVLKFGVQCRNTPGYKSDESCGAGSAAIKYLDKHPRRRPNGYNKLRKLYFRSSAVCNTLRPGKKDGALGWVEIFWYPSYTDFECVWGQPVLPSSGVRIVIKLPNPRHQWNYNDCTYYIGYGFDGCIPLSGGVQAGQNYFAGHGEQVLDSKKGFVRIARFAHNDAQYYTHVVDDGRMFSKIGLALGLPTTANAD